MKKMQKRLFACLLAAALLIVGSVGTSAQGIRTGLVGNSVTAEGEPVPYTMYINGVTTSLYQNGANGLRCYLNVSTTQTVTKIWVNLNLQKYTGSGWTTIESRYYEKQNAYDFDIYDTFSGLSSGQYRLTIDYNAKLYAQDYVYDESNTCFL